MTPCKPRNERSTSRSSGLPLKKLTLATIIGAIAVAGTACDSQPDSLSNGATPDQQHAAHGASHAAVYNQGEGEGAQGEGSGAADIASDDLAFLQQLALMRGHLYVGYRLYMEDHVAPAKTHMKHPESELYADLVPGLTAREAPGFGKQLAALAAAVESEQSKPQVSKRYEELVSAIAATEATASKLDAAQTLALASQLLRVAAEEYAIAVVDGKMENAHEYQDALGFTVIAREYLDDTTTREQAEQQAFKKAGKHLDAVQPLWPKLMPPATLEHSAKSLYGAAAQLELLSLSL